MSEHDSSAERRHGLFTAEPNLDDSWHDAPEPSWLIDFGELYHRRHGMGFLGWDVWQPSVDIDHPDYMKVFMREDLAPVSDEQARTRAAAAVAEALTDLRDVALPYLEDWARSRR